MGNFNLDYIQLTVNQAVSNEEVATTTPQRVALDQNYPNPFNPTTNISYSLPESERVRLTIYDLSGRRVAELADGFQSAGNHTVSWNASNMASGIYIYRLRAGGSTFTKKMILVK
jgi:flagellar hook assembly protein FlgD